MIQLTKVEHCHSLIKPWDPGTRDKFCWSDYARDMTCIGPFTFKNTLLLSHYWRPQNHHLPASIVPDIYWRSNCLGQNVTHGLGIVTRVQFIKFYFTHSVQKYLQFQTSIYPLRNNEPMLPWKNYSSMCNDFHAFSKLASNSLTIKTSRKPFEESRDNY